jgi:hypothetical protein
VIKAYDVIELHQAMVRDAIEGSAIIAGLDPAIHPLRNFSCEEQ